MRKIPGASVLVIAILIMGTTTAGAAQLQPIITERIADVTMRLLVEGGRLLIGPNDVVLELRPSPGRHDVRVVTLAATQIGAGPAPANVSLSPDGAGRFHGTMVLPSTENCRLQVTWQDDLGPHSHAVTVPVIVGHH
jgi:hypothetical protein